MILIDMCDPDREITDITWSSTPRQAALTTPKRKHEGPQGDTE